LSFGQAVGNNDIRNRINALHRSVGAILVIARDVVH